MNYDVNQKEKYGYDDDGFYLTEEDSVIKLNLEMHKTNAGRFLFFMCEDGSPWAKVTPVAIESGKIEVGDVHLVKSYSENIGILEILVKAGYVEHLNAFSDPNTEISICKFLKEIQ